MRRLKYAAIWLLDKVDDLVLRHAFHPRFCAWLVMHPWWGHETDEAPRRSDGRRGRR